MTAKYSGSILSIGCGKREPEAGVIRLDVSPEVNPDVRWDLNQFPYPFEDSSFQIIECFDVIEHLNSIPDVMEEFDRILVPGGVAKITTPHFSSANSYIDPTHKWHLSYFSFDYFSDVSALNYYCSARFTIVSRFIHFKGLKLYTAFARRLANKYPDQYEQHFAWIFPAFFLYFELRSNK
ncbi:MAG: class I SAM-dependent methyltransferase [Aphanocapsa sp. GSE-SYN-MK-11-07L]|jgi:SAM-dependent methyltransferase|nr:class I SAM-dependent methyltransferase [Aphanocapsa sp. GSE-SYN-MK-11-07L]